MKRDDYPDSSWLVEHPSFGGDSGYAHVHRGTHRDDDKKVAALKIMNGVGRRIVQHEAFQREKAMMEYIRDRFIKPPQSMRCFCELFEGWSINDQHHVLAVELLEGVDLFDYLANLYRGVVVHTHTNNTFDILFDDGIRQRCPVNGVPPEVGDRVTVEKQWFLGEVKRIIDEETLEIEFNDGIKNLVAKGDIRETEYVVGSKVSSKKKITEENLRTIIKPIFDGLAALHGHNIAHWDLKVKCFPSILILTSLSHLFSLKI